MFGPQASLTDEQREELEERIVIKRAQAKARDLGKEAAGVGGAEEGARGAARGARGALCAVGGANGHTAGSNGALAGPQQHGCRCLKRRRLRSRASSRKFDLVVLPRSRTSACKGAVERPVVPRAPCGGANERSAGFMAGSLGHSPALVAWGQCGGEMPRLRCV